MSKKTAKKTAKKNAKNAAKTAAEKSAKRPHDRQTEATRASLDYAGAVARITLTGLAELQEAMGPIVRRRLVNHLRGNQAAPRSGEPATTDGGHGVSGLSEIYGIFWAETAAWVEEVVDGLIEEGYIDLLPPPRRALTIPAAGERLRRGRERPGASWLPRRPLLGSHPALEERLRALRRRLALEESRPPYGVFSNATLAYLATHRPGNLGELAAVPGLGARRVQAYGRKILAALKKGEKGKDKDRR